MATLRELQNYLGYEFSSSCYTGNDYKQFQTKYINYLRTLCRKHNWELVNIGRNHYEFSAFIKDENNKYVYLSISDVRGSNRWYYSILIRTASSERDYRGGHNYFSDLEMLDTNIARLFTFD